MRSKRDIKMGRLCTPGGAVLGIVGGGVTFRFLNGEAILDVIYQQRVRGFHQGFQTPRNR